MDLLTLLADGQPTDPIKLLTQGIVVVLTATGLASLFVRGFYVKFVEPMFLNTLNTWYTHKDQASSRQVETQKTVESWYRSPDVQQERKTYTEGVLDSHIHRDDGLIHREIQNRVSTSADALNGQIAEQRRMLEEQAKENRKFQEAILDALRELQTSVSYLHGRQGAPPRAATDPVPTTPPPPPPRPLGVNVPRLKP
jgi:hypothetical protein